MQGVKFVGVFRLDLLPAGGVRVRVSPAAGVNPPARDEQVKVFFLNFVRFLFNHLKNYRSFSIFFVCFLGR